MNPNHRRGILYILRGLPGSGKSWYARNWVAGDPDRRVRVGRDDLRMMLRGGGGHGERITEKRIDAARDAVITAMLSMGADVVVDSTNLNPKTIEDLVAVAHRCRAAYQVVDFTTVPLETCLARNAERSDVDRVPEEWIRGMHARYIGESQVAC